MMDVTRLPMFVSNAMDSSDPKPVGIHLNAVRHFRMEGGGVVGPQKTTVLYDGRMVQIFNEHSEDITFTGLVFDLKRPTVSEFRTLEVGLSHAVIQIAEGFVSQFAENIIYQRVNVAPPGDSIRTCAAWGDIFQFSNCKGDVLVDSCRLSGMQDDAINCHGTYLRIIGKIGDNQLLMRFMHPQTYGFAAFAPGDEVAVICHSNLREYTNNPRRKVSAVQMKSDKDWLLTLDGPAPAFEKEDVLDNITWYPNIIARNNHVSMDPVRGFLLSTRGRTIIENNSFHRCVMAAILVGGDAEEWFESGPVRDMLICGNTFIGCGISITPNTQSNKPEEPVHENIRITDNNFDAAGVSAKGVRGLTVTGNRSPGGSIKINLEPSCTETLVNDNERKK